MSFPTLQAAKLSLLEFAPFMRRAHRIVRYWSDAHDAWRFARVLSPRQRG